MIVDMEIKALEYENLDWMSASDWCLSLLAQAGIWVDW